MRSRIRFDETNHFRRAVADWRPEKLRGRIVVDALVLAGGLALAALAGWRSAVEEEIALVLYCLLALFVVEMARLSWHVYRAPFRQRDELRALLEEAKASEAEPLATIEPRYVYDASAVLLAIANHGPSGRFEVRLDYLEGLHQTSDFPLELPSALPWGDQNTKVGPELKERRLREILHGGVETVLFLGLMPRQTNPPHNLIQLCCVSAFSGFEFVHGSCDTAPYLRFGVTVLGDDRNPQSQEFFAMCIDQIFSVHPFAPGASPVDKAIDKLSQKTITSGNEEGRCLLELLYSHRREFLKGVALGGWRGEVLEAFTVLGLIETERIPASDVSGTTYYSDRAKLSELGRELLQRLERGMPAPVRRSNPV